MYIGMKPHIKMKNKIKEIRKRLEKEYAKASKECVKKSYNPEKDDWNPEHFKYCEADLIAKQLDLLDEIENEKM